MKSDPGNGTARRIAASTSSNDPHLHAGLQVGDVLQMLLRRKTLILLSALVCALAAFLYSRSLVPEYEATATIRIDQERASSLGLGELGGTQAGASVDIATEIAIIQSDRIISVALQSLSDPEYRRMIGSDRSPTAAESSSRQDALLSGIKLRLHAKEVGETQLVAIAYRDKDAQSAATFVNHVVAAYLRQNFESRYSSVTQAKEWLSQQMAELKARSTESQRKLADFQEQNGILSVANSNTTTDTLRLLGERLEAAQADRILKEAQMRAAANGSPAVLASMFPDPKLQALQSEQGRLSAQYAQLAAKFGPNYTPLAQLKQQMQAVDSEVARSVNSVRTRLQQDYTAAKNNEDMLSAEYNEQTQKAYAMNREQAQLAVLQSEGTASRELYNTLEYKLQQAGVDAGLSGVNTMQVDSARPPVATVGPPTSLLIAVGAILGLVVGICAVFLVEMTLDNVQNNGQLQSTTGYYVLPTIPHISLRTDEPSAIALTKSRSSESESFRKLRNLLITPEPSAALKTLLVGSAQSEEGKTLVAVNLAIVLAQTGARVLIIDTDLRRPTLHTVFSVENVKGLTDVLLSDRTPAIQRPVETVPNLAVLTAGPAIELPSEALASTSMASLLAALQDQFDYLILKAAPLLVVSDCVPLAGLVDGVLIVTRQGKTPLPALKKLREMLDRVGANVVGILMNDASHSFDAGTEDKDYGRGRNAT